MASTLNILLQASTGTVMVATGAKNPKPVGVLTNLVIPLTLRWKSLHLHGLEFRQYYMDHASLYPGLKKAAVNYRPIIEYFWSRALSAGSSSSRESQEVYLLSYLLPHVRSIKSRTIFDDAIPLPSAGAKRRPAIRDWIKTLDATLKAEKETHLSADGFTDRTRDALRLEQFSDQDKQLYRTMTASLFDGACGALALLGERDAQAMVREQWTKWHRSIGRRAGNAETKKVLNILSYEARTAYFQCYSALWSDLIEGLARRDGWSQEAKNFHLLWQLELRREEAGATHHLFHGHIFGLHPAFGPFLQTPTGRELMGRYIQKPHDIHSRRTLMNGLQLAVWAYRAVREDLRDGRKGSAYSLVDDDTIESPEGGGRPVKRRGRGRARPATDD